MSSQVLTDEQKVKYENEFAEFLIQRIKKSCGSLSFQHLVSLLPQLNFEIRDTVGSTKSQVMKFLKSHPKKFKVDSKGVVTIVDTPIMEKNNDYDNECSNLENNSLPATITNGSGKISNIHTEFGFIKANEPVVSTVYFRGAEYGGDKDSVLSTLDIEVGWTVCFNAVIAHTNSVAKYRATKVWRKLKDQNSDDEHPSSSSKRNKNNHSSSKSVSKEDNTLHSEGIITKIFPRMGFISVEGKKNETVFFHKTALVDYDDIEDIQTAFEVGDCVTFNANKSCKKDSKAQWEAVAVWKICKQTNKKKKSVSYDSENCSDNEKMHFDLKHKKSNKQTKKNVHGKIIFQANDVSILFGEKFTEIADGNSSTYFFYGSKVKDITWEFSDGDEVCFDAVSIKSGWKAVLVWVGDRPDYIIFTDEELDENLEEKNFSSRPVMHSSDKVTNKKAHSYNTELTKDKKYLDHHDPSIRKDKNDYHREQRYINLGSSQSSLNNVSSRDSNQFKKHRKELKQNYASKHIKEKWIESENSKTNSARDNVSSRDSDQFKKLRRELKQKNTSKHIEEKQIKNQYRNKNSIRNYQQTSLLKDEALNSNVSTDICMSDDSQSDTEFQTVSKSSSARQDIRKYLNDSEHKPSRSFYESEEDEDCEIMPNCETKYFNHSEHKFLGTFHESQIKEELVSCNKEVISEHKKKSYGKASIKKYKGIEGIITKVHCKVAYCQNSDLQESVHFLSNTFYYNGKSVEELQLEDLRERLSKSDVVKLNCFEIVDDFGELRQTVTLAYIGEQPKISEITPEDFIDDQNLSVTLSDESVDQKIQTVKDIPKKFLSTVSNTDSDDESEISLKSSSAENSCDDEISLPSKYSMSNSNKQNVIKPSSEKKMESTGDYKLLLEMISQKIENRGLLFLESEDKLNALSTEIVDIIVLQLHGTGNSDHLPMNLHSNEEKGIPKDPVCSHCAGKLNGITNKSSKAKHKEVQTIVTGDIVAQNYFQHQKRNL